MRESAKTGIGFGITSAVITTLGLMVGVSSGTHSRLAVIGSVLTVSIADSFSDALGIHIMQESEGDRSHKAAWKASMYAFLTKIILGISFIIPLILLPMSLAILIAGIYGLFLLGVFSYYIGTFEKKPSWKVVLEHEIVAVIVIFASHYVGVLISVLFA